MQEGKNRGSCREVPICHDQAHARSWLRFPERYCIACGVTFGVAFGVASACMKV